MKQLPHEIIQNILSRLPTKKVIQFSTVSKLWFKLVNKSALFHDLHSDRDMMTELSSSIVVVRHDRIGENVITSMNLSVGESVSLNDDVFCHLISHSYYYYAGTCNGLLCFAPDNLIGPIVLCNPVTRERLTFPRSTNPSKFYHHLVGLGFNPYSKEYKVFQFSFPKKDGLYSDKFFTAVLEVCTLGDQGKLKEVQGFQDTPYGTPLYVDGKIYWALDQQHHQSRDQILSIDVGSERCNILSLPWFPESGPDDYHSLLNLLQFEGCLAVAAHDPPNSRVYLWVLKDHDRNHWEHRYTCAVPYVSMSSNIDKHFHSRMATLIADRVLLLWFYDVVILLYDLRRYPSKSSLRSAASWDRLLYCALSRKHAEICGDYHPSLVSLRRFVQNHRGTAHSESVLVRRRIPETWQGWIDLLNNHVCKIQHSV